MNNKQKYEYLLSLSYEARKDYLITLSILEQFQLLEQCSFRLSDLFSYIGEEQNEITQNAIEMTNAAIQKAMQKS